jgi:UDP-N-acetylglucosamine:LPS N-acetylglucosamine transferase
MTKKIELLYFNAGGGHRAAAGGLEAALRQAAPAHDIRLTNVIEVLDPGARFLRLTGMAPEDWYNKRLATGFTAGLRQELKLFQGLVRLGHGMLSRALEQHWLRSEPDIVVSLIPNLNRPLCASLAAVLPGVPYLTVMTDLADYPPDFWIVPDQRQHVVCGTDHAVRQAAALGCDPRYVHRASGMILRPDFYQPDTPDRDGERRALGLDPQRPTGLVLFGGHGSRAMVAIAESLADVQLIMMCGHNARLQRQLQALPSKAPRAVLGFTPDVPHYMRLADFFIGKPGPGSLSEAVHCGLPVVTVLNSWTLPQERFNPSWITELGLGISGSSFKRLREPVAQLLANLQDYSARVRAMPANRAVHEIVELIERMLQEPVGAHASQATSLLPQENSRVSAAAGGTVV